MGYRSKSIGPAARLAWGFVAALIAIAMTGTPARSAPEDLEIVGGLDLDIPDDVNPTLWGPNTDLIFDSANRRAFHVMRANTGTIARVIDLDTHRIIAERRFESGEMGQGPMTPQSTAGNSVEWIHTIDPETGRLFIAYQSGGGFAGVLALDGATLDTIAQFPQEIVTYDPPELDPADPQVPCAAVTCLPQPPTVQPQLVSLSFVPAVLTGLRDKVLLLMQDGFWPPGTDNNGNIAWIAQWDAETGRQDWIYNIRACSNARYPGRSRGNFMLGMFQARLGTGIFVTCALGGGTGQVVRLEADAQNVPQSEQSFPGPRGVTDAIPDPDADRMLLRVANEEGQSWWVFDGPSNSYTGVIGATLQPAPTANGLDPTSGRLYTLAPRTFGTNTVNEGGLLMSDIRRSPAPQFLSFERFARNGTGAIRVDVHPLSGERLLYMREKIDRYQIIQDHVPISEDPPLQDLDRLTVDVQEEVGITGRNFTGSGHGYGVRALFAGGIEGFPPTGPDTGVIRVGRWVPLMAGSPCFTGDRELVVGSVRTAGLSNSLSNASAAVGQADPGTKTDVGEPTARCYPRPKDQNREDIWSRYLEDSAGDYPRPLDSELDDDDNDSKTDVDEIAGSDWPFVPTECAGDEDNASITTLYPADRGDPDPSPIPEDVRSIGADLERFRAEANCDLAGGRVDATAQIMLYDETVDAPAFVTDVPQIGEIRVAEVSSTVSIFLDPERGLIARAVSVARGISIGDHISIDAALAIAESQAAGLPGTADTTFQRRLCGVRIKDEAPGLVVNRPEVETNPDQIVADPANAVDPEGGGVQPKHVDQQICGDPNQPQVGGTVEQNTGIDQEKPVIDVLNRILGSRAQARLPEPDPALQQGTPGGYLASVQKDRLEEISARAVNNDPSTQVPALEIVVFNDDPTEGRGRQLYQFAGVDASVTYGIFLLNPHESFDDLPDALVDLTGGVPDLPDLQVPEQPAGNGPPSASGPITVLFEGVNFLFRSPIDALLAAAVWALLFAPVQLAGRRRALKGLP